MGGRFLAEFELYVMLAVARLGDEAYGVAIRETIEERTGKVVSSGAIYTALGRLGDRGFVSHRVAESTEGRVGRPRKYYRMEPAGARALKATYSRVQAMAVGQLAKLSELAEE